MTKILASAPATAASTTTDEAKPSAFALAARASTSAAAVAAEKAPQPEPTTGGSFIRQPETGTLQRDPEQPALEGDRFRTKYAGAEPDEVRDAQKKSAS